MNALAACATMPSPSLEPRLHDRTEHRFAPITESGVYAIQNDSDVAVGVAALGVDAVKARAVVFSTRRQIERNSSQFTFSAVNPSLKF
jgi:hypothetical protein